MDGKKVKLCESEIKVMNIFWDLGEIKALRVCEIMQERYGWEHGSTYCSVKRCIKKGCLERIDPGFYCKPLVPKKQVYMQVQKNMFCIFFGEENLTQKAIDGMVKSYYKYEQLGQ